MRILFASAEFSPLAIVGGLGSASSGLVRELRALGHDVELMIPDYGGVELDNEIIDRPVMPSWAGPMTLRSGVHPIAGAVTLVITKGITVVAQVGKRRFARVTLN